MSDSIYDFSVSKADGTSSTLSEYQGKVLLVVNTASKCGLTPQFSGLEALNQKYAERGLQVIGFPCNQFAQQEPGTMEEISSFCQLNYGVTFPMLAKVDVNGTQAEPLFKFLRQQAKGLLGSTTIKWNFNKFLISRDGSQITRYAPATKPEALEAAIEALLEQPQP
ncbi:glutathione peroxidase [Sinobacterium caligoides]|uniref:Glutathione peroxidase n=1 Tax=Sinobacterium caligoides TaxID=933926 RepID=A0A3N2DG56_9GAMM|nr:glutathione peroxidase [Sinobacterium caligoides]ROR98783.1 glutathione peroxidase [Sinobacterium caligoides]